LGGHELARSARAPGEHATLDPVGVPPRPRQLAGDESGVVAVIFALTFSAIFLAVAVAFDYARWQTEVVRLQNGVAAAALAASHGLGLPDHAPKHVVMDADKGEVVATARDDMLTSLSRPLASSTSASAPARPSRRARLRSRWRWCSTIPARWRVNPSTISSWPPKT